MAVVPQVITETKASGAQVIDGSLKFSGDSHLIRTPSSAGNQRTYTFSFWAKPCDISSNTNYFFTAGSGTPGGTNNMALNFDLYNRLVFGGYKASDYDVENTEAYHRDTGWYHFVAAVDTTQGTAADRVKFYVNGVEQSKPTSSSQFAQNSTPFFNSTVAHTIGSNGASDYSGHMSQVYLIDGQALDASYFGYTDPLTNTWRPKKYNTSTPTNNPNNGTTWSNNASVSSGSFGSGEEATKGFDGNTGTKAKTTANGASITITFSGINVERLLRIRTNYTNGTGSDVEVNDVSYGSAPTASDGEFKTISGFTGALTKIKLEAGGSVNAAFSAIEVDGVILQDSTTTNNRTWNSTVTFGTNGFNLPMDGNSPIGDDKSGQGNNWTPVNFGGSVALDNPIVSGAKPILNTGTGGTVARPGVFGSEVGAYYAVTVSNPGSGNKYYFDTVLTPTPTFYRGSTYTFDYTAATSHPLYLSALSDGKHNSKAYSVQFDGTGDYLTLAQSNDFDLTGDYTYEAFIYYTDTSNNPTIFDFSAASGNYEGRLQIQAGTLYLYNSGWVSKGAISANTWHHIAVTQDFIFVDGINIGSGTGAISGSNYKVVTIGARTNDGGTSYGDYFTGYISNARIVNGTALYTENFTVPTTTLTNVTNTKLLCCQDNNATTAVVAPGDITAVGNAAASNTYNPFVYNIDNYFGVDASTSNVTKQVIPHSAVDTLYYFCNIHSGMGGSANIVTDETKADPYAWKNVLAVPFAGSTNDVSNQINSGSTTKADTNSGSTATNSLSNFYGGSRNFDGSNDTCSFASVPACGAGDWTVEFWVYSEASSLDTVYRRIVSTGTNATSSIQIGHIGSAAASGEYITYTHSDGGVYAVNTSKVTDRWAHIAVVRESGSVNVYTDGIKGTTADSDANNKTGTTWYVSGYGGSTSSGRFNGKIQDLRVYPGVAKYTSDFVVPATSPDILPDTPSGVSGGSKLAKVTDGAVSFNGSDQYLNITDSSDLTVGTNPFTLEFYAYKTAAGEDFFCGSSNSSGATSSMSYSVQTGGGSPSNSLRAHVGDGSSLTTVNSGIDFVLNKWVHIAFVRDGNTLRLFQDGSQMATTSFSGTVKDSSDPFMIGRGFGADSVKNFPGFISNFRFVNGTALYTTDFTPPTAPLTDVTNTKLLCCQSNTSAIEAAVSPSTPTNGGSSAATNFNPFNTDINTVRGQESGYCTWNPLAKGNINLSDGNLTAIPASNDQSCFATFSIPDNGKVYFEFTCIQRGGGGAQSPIWGVGDPSGVTLALNPQNSDNNASTWLYGGDGNKTGGGSGSTSYGTAFVAGDIIGVCVDRSNSRIWFSKNNVWQNGGNPNNPTDSNAAFTNVTSTGTLIPFYGNNNGTAGYGSANFGQKPFKFPPPAGFQPLNAANARPVKVFARPDQYVGVATYTSGNGSAVSINSYNFAPDLIFIKDRDGNNNWAIFDKVRGYALRLDCSATGGQQDWSDYFSSFDPNGFTVTSTTSDINRSTNKICSWGWKAGGDKNTFNVDDVGYASAAAAGLDGGSLDPAGASVNTKSKFGIYTWAGHGSSNETLAHGLGAKPDFMVCKKYSISGNNWVIWHKSLTSVEYLMFTDVDANDDATLFNSHTNDSDNLWSLGTNNSISDTGQSAVAYLWCDVPGLQKFGSYTGVNSTDGPFLELGFRPSIIMFKNISSSSTEWVILDNKRNGFNGTAGNNILFPSTSGLENATQYGDFLSNGWKFRINSSYVNSTDTFIYAAWAEAPTFNLFGAQSNAR